ncbi:MAG: MFS transporter [Limnohabitans sp.]
MTSSLSDLLAQRQFMRFWLARICGITAHQMLMLAISWHMYELTNSAWDLGLVGLFQFIPALLMALPAGHVIDRLHRGRIFATCMAVMAVVAVVLGIATLQDQVSRTLIFGVAFVLGLTRAFQMPAQQAITPLLVPKPLFQRAIALSSTGVEVAVICGPALGGFLYLGGALTVYRVCAVLFTLSMLLTLWVRYEHVARHHSISWQSLFAGVAFVWQRKVLLGAISLDLFAVLLGGATALLPIFARDILHVGPDGLGLLRAAPAAGALCMSVVITRWPIQRNVGYKLLGAVAVFGLALMVFGMSDHFMLSMVALAVSGAADNISVVTRLTLMQMETPDEMRGRVAAVNGVFIGASNELGEFESGLTAALWGPVASVVTGGLATMAIALGWLKLFPDLARRDRL